MKQLIYGFDVDGVLANFVERFSELMVDVSRDNRFPPGYWYDPDFPPTWDWAERYGYQAEQIDQAWSLVKQSSHFWRTLPPLPAGVWALDRLPLGSRIYFISSRRGSTALGQTQSWIRQHLGRRLQYHEWSVLITHNKGAAALATELDFYIDDYHRNVNQVVRMGSRAQVHLLDKPYNRDVPVDTRVFRVYSVEAALICFANTDLGG